MWRTIDESERSHFFRRCLVLREEEYENFCRMTAEKCDKGHVAITCVIFGAAVQSVSCEEEEFPALFETMQAELVEIFESDLSEEERKRAYDEFFRRHSTVKIHRRIADGV